MAVVLVSIDQGRVTPRVAGIIQDVRKEVKLPAGSLRVMQGSYNRGVAASAGVHDGGGAFDVSITGLSDPQIVAVTVAFRRRNVCFWPRLKKYGWNGSPHGHGVVRDEPGLSDAAKKQIKNYDAGNNSLAGDSRQVDRLPHPKQFPVEKVRQMDAKQNPLQKPGDSVFVKFTGSTAKTLPTGKKVEVGRFVLPKGHRCLVTLQLRLPEAAKPAPGWTPVQHPELVQVLKAMDIDPNLGPVRPWFTRIEFVRIGWGADKDGRDATGLNPAFSPDDDPCSFSLHHELAGGGPLAYVMKIQGGDPTVQKLLIPTIVCKATVLP